MQRIGNNLMLMVLDNHYVWIISFAGNIRLEDKIIWSLTYILDNFCTHLGNQLLHNWGKLHYCGFVFLIAWTRNYLQYVIDDGKNITGKENNDNAH